MTRVPMFIASTIPEQHGMGNYRGTMFQARYPGIDPNQFAGAEMLAEKYALSKDDIDVFALESHRKAANATLSGAFEAEIVPLEVITATGERDLHKVDEGIRFEASLTAIQQVKLMREGGVLTAATASQVCDGASALMVVNERGLKSLGTEPLARIHHMTVLGADPVIMLEAPIPATERALAKTGMTIDAIDLYEVNEAFASVPMAWLRRIDADDGRLNVNGGAIALGHPLGASGTKLMTTLIYALKARNKRFGLQTMCEGGGLANVTIIERL
jgi:acetyl-CoA C-acetyltransferase